MTEKAITKTEFKRMRVFLKGYMVYMHGCRKEQPNIPESFNNFGCEWSEGQYKDGQQLAVQEAQDSP